MRKSLTIVTIVIMAILSQGCVPLLRSAKGLKAGEIQTTCSLYNIRDGKAGGIVSARVGVTEKVEIQYIGNFGLSNYHNVDVFTHFHKKSYDFGFTGGCSIISNDDPLLRFGWYPLPYVSATISKEYFNRFNPYIGCNFGLVSLYPAIGCETYLFNRETSSFNIFITPEISWTVCINGAFSQASLGFGVTLF